MKKTGQLATKSKKNAVQANKKNTPKKGLIKPKKVQPNRCKGKSVGSKKLPAKNGKNSTKKDEEEPEDDSEVELNNMQEDSGESNGIGNGATNGSDAPDDSSSDDDDGISGNARQLFGNGATNGSDAPDDSSSDDDDGISGYARQLFGKLLSKIQATSDDDDDQQGEDSEEENEVNPIKKESRQEDDVEEDEDDDDDDEDQDNDEEEEGNVQNNEDEDEEDVDGPDEENIKKEYPKEAIDLWDEKQGKTPKNKDQSVDEFAKRTVFVQRLKNRTTEEDIRNHFKSFGEIKTVTFEKRARMPGAVVTFADVASSKAALKMSNTILNDFNIIVRHAQEPKESTENEERSILVLNVDKLEKLEGERLEKIFSKVGEIEKLFVVCEPKVLAFLTFKTQEAAIEAQKLDGTVQDDLKIHVKPYKEKKPMRIFISNISANATEADLRKMFEPCGQINHIALKQNQYDVTCFVTFDTEESFCKSFLLHEEMLLGKPLNLKPCSRITLPKKPFQKNKPYSGPFQGNKPSSRGSFRGNNPSSRGGSFRGNNPSSRGSFRGNNPSSRGGSFRGNNPSSRGSFRGNNPSSRGSFRGNNPSSRGSFRGNNPSSRGSFRGNNPSSRGSFRGNNPSSRGSFRGNNSSSRGSFRDNSWSSRDSFRGNRPNSGQFNGKRPFPDPSDGQISQSLNMWKSGPLQKTSKIDITKKQPANE